MAACGQLETDPVQEPIGAGKLGLPVTSPLEGRPWGFERFWSDTNLGAAGQSF